MNGNTNGNSTTQISLLFLFSIFFVVVELAIVFSTSSSSCCFPAFSSFFDRFLFHSLRSSFVTLLCLLNFPFSARRLQDLLLYSIRLDELKRRLLRAKSLRVHSDLISLSTSPSLRRFFLFASKISINSFIIYTVTALNRARYHFAVYMYSYATASVLSLYAYLSWSWKFRLN